MRVLLLFLLLSSPALAESAPSCNTPPAETCGDGRPSCTNDRVCVDDSGCTRTQTIYIQDCNRSPVPSYCSLITNPWGQKNVWMLRERKVCPLPPG
jgi:hypothetical protein